VRILVAGVGNLLRCDDGFGVVVAHRLLEHPLPPEVRVVDIGIGGIHLVQDLLASPIDALYVLDAVDFGKEPGTVLVIRPEVVDLSALPPEQRRDQLADMHWATPERAFLLARAMGVLPVATWVLGSQPADAASPGLGLSPEVARAVDVAIRELRSLVRDLGVDWPVEETPDAVAGGDVL
jgi:hydrogenase maturation protease